MLSETTLNYWMMLEGCPNFMEEVGGSMSGCEISSLLDINLARWSTTPCALALAYWGVMSQEGKEKESKYHVQAYSVNGAALNYQLRWSGFFFRVHYRKKWGPNLDVWAWIFEGQLCPFDFNFSIKPKSWPGDQTKLPPPPTYLRAYDWGEPAVSYKWTGRVEEMIGWSWRLQENCRSF